MEFIFYMFIAKALDPVLAITGIIGVWLMMKVNRGRWVIVPAAILAAVISEILLMTMQASRDFGQQGSVIMAFIVSMLYGYLGYRFLISREKRSAPRDTKTNTDEAGAQKSA